MSEQEAQVPDQVEGEPVVEVQEATDPLTPEEVREAQEADTEQPLPGRRNRTGPGRHRRRCRPNRCIDYIWLSGDLAARFVATASTASDHRGVAVTIRPA
jgi:endonuclease/exonuclease/phosphatase family metal-dependent hydrolase